MRMRYVVFTGVLLLAAVLITGVSARGAESAAPPAAEPEAEETPSEPAEGEEAEITLDQRLKNLQAALEKYCDRHFGRIPRTIDALVEYLKEKEKGLINPETNKPIVMNPKMVNMSSETITNPSVFITFHADKDTPNKGRAVIFGDSKVKYLKKEEFNRLLKASVATRIRRDSTDRQGMGRRRRNM